jgi:hypothetical protein
MIVFAFKASIEHMRTQSGQSYTGDRRVRMLPQSQHRFRQGLILGTPFTKAKSSHCSFWIDGDQKPKAIEPTQACTPADVRHASTASSPCW